jgi:hypothetical protein
MKKYLKDLKESKIITMGQIAANPCVFARMRECFARFFSTEFNDSCTCQVTSIRSTVLDTLFCLNNVKAINHFFMEKNISLKLDVNKTILFLCKLFSIYLISMKKIG